jgi:anti-sigma B factor antagonist
VIGEGLFAGRPPLKEARAIDLKVESQAREAWTVVSVTGEVDVYTAGRLREEIVGLVDRGRHHLAVDLEGVEFMDSTGLGVLITGLKRIREQAGELVLIAPRDQIRRLLTITGLDRVLPVHESVDEAMAQSAS